MQDIGVKCPLNERLFNLSAAESLLFYGSNTSRCKKRPCLYSTNPIHFLGK